MILQVPPSRDKKNTPREVQPGDELVEAEVDKNGNRDSHTGGFFHIFGLLIKPCGDPVCRVGLCKMMGKLPKNQKLDTRPKEVMKVMMNKNL